MCDAASQIPIQNSEVCTSFEFPFLPIFSSLHFLRRQIGDWWRKFQRVVGLLPARLHWAEEYLPWWNFKRRQTVMGNYTIPRQTGYDEVVLNNLTLLHKSESTSLILFRRTSIESWEDKLTTPLIETCIPPGNDSQLLRKNCSSSPRDLQTSTLNVLRVLYETKHGPFQGCPRHLPSQVCLDMSGLLYVRGSHWPTVQ